MNGGARSCFVGIGGGVLGLRSAIRARCLDDAPSDDGNDAWSGTRPARGWNGRPTCLSEGPVYFFLDFAGAFSAGGCRKVELGATTVFLVAFGFLASRLLRNCPLAMVCPSAV